MPAVTGPNLGLRFGFNLGEGDWNNEADGDQQQLDAVVQPAVIDKDISTPPVSPSEGDRYIVGPTATGVWTGNEDKIARFRASVWEFFTPKDGWLFNVLDESLLYEFNGSAWAIFSSTPVTFLALTDTPGSFAGASLQFVRVNVGQTALEFATPAGAGNVTGPGTSTTDALARYADGTGTLLADSGWLLDGSNILNAQDNILRRPQIEDYSETVDTINPAAAAQNIDFQLGNVADITVNQATVLTVINPPASGISGTIQVIIRQNGTGGFAVTFADTITFVGTGGVAPTLPLGANEFSVIALQTVDGGTSYIGYFAGASV